ncbi:hypothetical protein ACVH9Z_31135 [Rhodococcus opacus]
MLGEKFRVFVSFAHRHASNATSRVALEYGPFVCWIFIPILRACLITGIEVPRKKDGLPQRFQDHDEHAEQLRRCLTDDELPLEFRIVGALVRLYAIPVARIVELTYDRFHRDDTHAYLVIEQNPVVLPPSLAALIEELIRVRRSGGRAYSGPGVPALMFPGKPPSRPRNTNALHRDLKKYGLPTLAARNSAMIANIVDLEPVVVSDLFGIAPQTAHRWAQYAQTSWATYLAARSAGPQPL